VVRFAGKAAVVTGGGSGIGAAICRRLAEEGATVAVADIDVKAGTLVARSIMESGGAAFFAEVDLGDLDSIAGVADAIGRHVNAVHVLVNNAGIVRRSLIANTGSDDWTAQITINLRAPAVMAKAMLPMLRTEGGAIVNISSEGAFRPRSSQWVYDSSKAGVGALTRAMAVEFADYGIRANEVAPGWIVTEMHFATAPDPLARKRELEEMSNDQCIMGRLGRPSEIAGVVAFLASDDASYITGSTLHADGGMGLG
jgi:NAD(P)-dependent dehydrogenase (short-subunit alcohol dehydrogenase family)